MQLHDTLALALLGGSLVAAGAAACGARSSFNDPLAQGEGGAGGSTGPGNTSSTGTTTTTTTVTSTGTGTTVTCDDMTTSCDECQLCSVAPGGPCEPAYIACNESMDCIVLLNCVIDCQDLCANDPDPGCFDFCVSGPNGCEETFPGGVDELNALLDCVLGEQCPVQCG